MVCYLTPGPLPEVPWGTFVFQAGGQGILSLHLAAAQLTE